MQTAFELSRAGRYRKRAEELRAMAENTSNEEVKKALLDTAASFDQLVECAKYVGQRSPLSVIYNSKSVMSYSGEKLPVQRAVRTDRNGPHSRHWNFGPFRLPSDMKIRTSRHSARLDFRLLITANYRLLLNDASSSCATLVSKLTMAAASLCRPS